MYSRGKSGDLITSRLPWSWFLSALLLYLFRDVPTHRLATKDKAREMGTKAGVGGWQCAHRTTEGFTIKANLREVESRGWEERRKGEGDQWIFNCSWLEVNPFCMSWHRRATIHNYMYDDFQKVGIEFSAFSQSTDKTLKWQMLS